MAFQLFTVYKLLCQTTYFTDVDKKLEIGPAGHLITVVFLSVLHLDGDASSTETFVQNKPTTEKISENLNICRLWS